MWKKLITLIVCLCLIGQSNALGQSSEMSKALEKIIYAGPDKFESLRSGEWKKNNSVGITSAKGKVRIPSIDRDCSLIEFFGEPISYACLSTRPAAQSRQAYQEIKDSLARVLPNWKFEEHTGKDTTYFYGGPRGGTYISGPVIVSLSCEKADECTTNLRIYSGRFSIADLPKNSSASAGRKVKGKFPPCDEQPGFSNTTLTVVTIVKPESGKTWNFPEAPSVLAAQLLQGLNQNTRNITFKEASGVTPNLYFNITLSESIEGTRRYQAYVEVTGLGKVGMLFRESSGENPFTNAHDAINKLSASMLKWFENGWSKKPPCIQADGSVRTQ
jgi:hypothetical protein